MSRDDLKRALQTVADAERPEADPGADLARARAAAGVRSRRRFRLGLTGVTAVAVLAIGATAVVDPEPDRAGVTASSGVELVAEPFAAAPYTFDLTPAGWSVQAQRPTAVTIAPDDGSTSSNPDDFRGKLVILFDTNRPTGQALEHDGRAFWVSGDSGYTVLATRTRGAEPAGVVRIQYPDGAGWDRESMVAFLASVHVGPGARHGLG
jgi:hypothetical protein